MARAPRSDVISTAMRLARLLVPGVLLLPGALLLASACGGDVLRQNGGGGGGGGTPATKLSGMGDSIMQGFDASVVGGFGADQPSFSFAQGTDTGVNSIYSRYLARGLPAGAKEFASKSGAEMVNNALAQAQAICAMVAKPDRIVILLGGNDVCNRTNVGALYPVATFRSALKAALDTLAAPACGLRAGSWVHVLSMPRVDELRAAGLAKDAGNGSTQCRTLYNAANVCTIVTRETNQVVLDQIGQRIDDYNDGLALEVAAADAASGGLAGVHFTTDWKGPMATNPGTSVGSYTFVAGDLSDIDCFHPSTAGQRRLACIAWETWEHGTGNVAACLQ